MKNMLVLCTLVLLWNTSHAQADYFPIEKGQTLTYAYGKELYQGAYDKMRIKVRVLDEEKTIEGEEYFVSETSTGSGDQYSVISTMFIRISDKGDVIVREKADAEESVMLKAFPTAGDTWTGISNNLLTKMKVVDEKGSITTAGKTFDNCLVVEQLSENGTTMRSYFKKGKGIVATSVITEGSEKVFIYLVEG